MNLCNYIIIGEWCLTIECLKADDYNLVIYNDIIQYNTHENIMIVLVQVDLFDHPQ